MTVLKLKDLTTASRSTLWRRANPARYQFHLRSAQADRKIHNLPKAVRTALMICFHSAKKSATVDNREFKLTKDFLQRQWILQEGKCKVSGIPMQTESGTVKERNNLRVSIDRIDNTKGYTKNNIHLVIWQVNNAKGADTMQSVFDLAVAIVKNNNLTV
jgi:hypothetical protein